MRIFKELFNPKLKCERIGHNPKEVNRKIRTGMNDYQQVAIVCRRCREMVKEISREHLMTWTSVSMPTDLWDEIRDKGYIVV